MSDTETKTEQKDLIVEEPSGSMLLNMGPSHPAMHGIVRIILQLEGEVVKAADMEIGYLHRAFEKHAESVTYTQVMPWTDRLNYVSPLINNFGYAMCVEKIFGIKVTERCEYVRVMHEGNFPHYRSSYLYRRFSNGAECIYSVFIHDESA